MISQFCICSFASSKIFYCNAEALHQIGFVLSPISLHSLVAPPHIAAWAPFCTLVVEHFDTFASGRIDTFRQSQCCIAPSARFCKPHCQQQYRSLLAPLGTRSLEPFLGQPGMSAIGSCDISDQLLWCTAPLDSLCTLVLGHCYTALLAHFGTGSEAPVCTLAFVPSSALLCTVVWEHFDIVVLAPGYTLPFALFGTSVWEHYHIVLAFLCHTSQLAHSDNLAWEPHGGSCRKPRRGRFCTAAVAPSGIVFAEHSCILAEAHCDTFALELFCTKVSEPHSLVCHRLVEPPGRHLHKQSHRLVRLLCYKPLSERLRKPPLAPSCTASSQLFRTFAH